VVSTGQFDIDKLEDQSTNSKFSNKIKEILQGEKVLMEESPNALKSLFDRHKVTTHKCSEDTQVGL